MRFMKNSRNVNDRKQILTQYLVHYLGMTLTTQNDIHDENKSRLNTQNACYYSVQIILSYGLKKRTKD